MSQIDNFNFLPNLLWFIFLFLIFYFIIFSYFLPLIYEAVQVRTAYFDYLLTENFRFNAFFYFCVHFLNIKSMGVNIIIKHFHNILSITAFSHLLAFDFITSMRPRIKRPYRRKFVMYAPGCFYAINSR